MSLEFFIDIKSFRSHYGPVVDSASNRNEYQEHFLGGKNGRCVRLKNLPPSCAVVMKSGNLNFLEPSGPLQDCKGTALLLIGLLDMGFHLLIFCTILYSAMLSTWPNQFNLCFFNKPNFLLSYNHLRSCNSPVQLAIYHNFSNAFIPCLFHSLYLVIPTDFMIKQLLFPQVALTLILLTWRIW